MDQKRGKVIDTSNFDWIGLKLASPERILDWSWGEVRKPETINYRTQRSEKDGLFDERIFGPERDFECYCGKYKGPRFRGIVCEKCGVEVTRSIVRRERMGHIELATPVTHIWFLRSVPSRIALILGTSATDAEKVIYFAGYIVTKVNEDERARLATELESEYKAKFKAVTNEKAQTELKTLMLAAKADIERIQPGVVLDEIEYHRFSVKYGTFFEAGIGAEAIYNIFKNLDMQKLASDLESALEKAGAAEREKINKRLSLVRSMVKAGVRPEWMFLTRIPVTPPALRPMVALESGRHATSDVNDLYRRVINRNNRLMKLRDIMAPEVILRNEKRILQEAVDALLDNSIRRGGAAFSAQSQAQRRPLKSLADYLKSKQGYFRFNLLGKRVDYSGRSVIVVGPDLDLDECGLPKKMALELFRPFIIARLLEQELAHNIRGAGRLIEEGIPEVWAILEEVIQGKYVLLNRAPTLHRQGIQAFRPRLVEGNAIQLHPLVCPAFNADFDGDQMAIHVPLSTEAQMEARDIMSAAKNVLKPGSGQPVIFEKPLDIALGVYWMTRGIPGEKGEGKSFPSPNAAILAYDFGDVGVHAKVSVQPTEGSAKYAMFKGQRFETTVGRLLFNSILPKDYPYVNDEVKKQQLGKLVDDVISIYGLSETPRILDKLKHFGFQFATKSGVTFSFNDLKIPEDKNKIVDAARKEAQDIQEQYENGLLTEDEKIRLTVEVWQKAIGDIEKEILPSLNTLSSVYTMVVSGARGSVRQLSQMAGMKGLVTNTKGEVIEFPVTSSMKEGLTPTEYFTTTHGSRKGLTDTALKTAHAGYLTRRLFDVAQDIIVTEADCGVKTGITIRKSRAGMISDLEKALVGRVLAKDVEAGGKSWKRGHLISQDDAALMDESGVEEAIVRSPMSCASERGICQKCYGADLATRQIIDIGEAVGTIAAQAIGEPGTQLTMRTFHTGGVATIGGDITHGLPRVEELFDKRPPKASAVLSAVSGEVSEIKDEMGVKTVLVLPDHASGKKDKIAYEVPLRRVPMVMVGQKVEKGDIITDGSVNLDELFELGGISKLQEYVIDEVSKIYDLQGASVSHKHMEVIIRQMFSRVRVTDPGASSFVQGEVIEKAIALAANRDLEAVDKEPMSTEPVVLGITEVSLNRKSFLSAASFQHTTRILIGAALKGSVDLLAGLKENVIVGRLIPAGTGFAGSKKHAVIKAFQEERAQQMAREMENEESRERIADIA